MSLLLYRVCGHLTSGHLTSGHPAVLLESVVDHQLITLCVHIIYVCVYIYAFMHACVDVGLWVCMRAREKNIKLSKSMLMYKHLQKELTTRNTWDFKLFT